MPFLLNISSICLNSFDGSKLFVFKVTKCELIDDFSGTGNETQLIFIQLSENSIPDDEVLLSYYSS